MTTDEFLKAKKILGKIDSVERSLALISFAEKSDALNVVAENGYIKVPEEMKQAVLALMKSSYESSLSDLKKELEEL